MADSDQPIAASAPGSTTLGQILREARVAKDLTIEQLATELRIEARQLTALEDNRFEQIGVPVFIKGYIRQYAQRLGLDQSALIDLYGRQTQLREVQIKPSRPIRLRDERQITVWVVGALVLLLVVVGLAVWWLNGGGGFDVRSVLPGAEAPAPRVEPARATVPAPASAAPAPASAGSAPASAGPAPVATEQPNPEPASDAATAPADVQPAAAPPAATPPPPAPAVNATQAIAVPASAVSRGATQISLDLTFDAESWAEITDARGQRLFFDLGTVGRHTVVRGEPPLSLTFGNGDAVRVLVDGESYVVPTQGRQGKLVRFSIAGHGE